MCWAPSSEVTPLLNSERLKNFKFFSFSSLPKLLSTLQKFARYLSASFKQNVKHMVPLQVCCCLGMPKSRMEQHTGTLELKKTSTTIMCYSIIPRLLYIPLSGKVHASSSHADSQETISVYHLVITTSYAVHTATASPSASAMFSQFIHLPVNWPEHSPSSSSILSCGFDGSGSVKSFLGTPAGVSLHVWPVSGDNNWDWKRKKLFNWSSQWTKPEHSNPAGNQTHLCGGGVPEGCQVWNGWDEVQDTCPAIYGWCDMFSYCSRRLVWWNHLLIRICWNSLTSASYGTAWHFAALTEVK